MAATIVCMRIARASRLVISHPEMFQLALSWAGGDVCSIDPARLHAFLTAYRFEYGDITVDWGKLSGTGYSWLEYNTKRALRVTSPYHPKAATPKLQPACFFCFSASAFLTIRFASSSEIYFAFCSLVVSKGSVLLPRSFK